MFPPLDYADDDGLLAIGGDLTVERLLTAYRNGIFPWPVEGLPLLWFAPPMRGILFFDEFHVSRSLRKQMRQSKYFVTHNQCFEEVIRACAAPREGEDGTWLLPPMIRAYTQLHRFGYAHSVEVWMDGELAGGLYGISIGGYFAGESMFHRRTGASKIALVHLVEHLQSRGATWLDTQLVNPLFESFGTREVPRQDFMKMLHEAQERPVRMFD